MQGIKPLPERTLDVYSLAVRGPNHCSLSLMAHANLAAETVTRPVCQNIELICSTIQCVGLAPWFSGNVLFQFVDLSQLIFLNGYARSASDATIAFDQTRRSDSKRVCTTAHFFPR